MLMINLVCLLVLIGLQCVTGNVVNIQCETSIDLCQTPRAIYTCAVEGNGAIEWSFYENNPAQSPPTVIELDEDQAIGERKRARYGTAFVTRRGQAGTRTALLIEVSPDNVHFKELNIACKDAGGHKQICPPTNIIPEVPMPPIDLRITSRNQKNIKFSWTPPFLRDYDILKYMVKITPSPIEGSCRAGQCIVHASDFDQCIGCDFIILTLEYGIPYNLTVQSVNCRGSGDPTEPFSITLQEQAPSKLTTSNVYPHVVPTPILTTNVQPKQSPSSESKTGNNSQLSIPIHWIVLAVAIPCIVVIIVTFFAVIFVWCCFIKNQPAPAPEIPQDMNFINNATYSSVVYPEHIYVPEQDSIYDEIK